MSAGMPADLKPVVLRSAGGTLLSGALQNAKAFRKSLENKQLWVYEPEGGRVLPHDSAPPVVEMIDHGDWYEAVIAESETVQAAPGRNGVAQLGETGPSPGAVPEDHGALQQLEHLAEVIAARRREMPQGSYTSYLFREGEDKVRKKTGEEAIELILAQDNQELCNEAADLIYHMLVLFELRGLTVGELMGVLRARE